MNKPNLKPQELLALKHTTEDNIKILKLKAFFAQRELRWINSELKKREVSKDELAKQHEKQADS